MIINLRTKLQKNLFAMTASQREVAFQPSGTVLVLANIESRRVAVLRRGAEAEGLRDAVFEVATRASDHLITAQQMLSNLRAGKDVGHDFEHEGEEGHEYDALESSKDSPLRISKPSTR